MMPLSQNLMLQRAVDRGTKSSLIGILVNLALVLAKYTAGLVGHSFALVTDGLDSAADVVSGLVVLFFPYHRNAISYGCRAGSTLCS